MKLKNMLIILLITVILNIALGVVAIAIDDPCPWSMQPNSIINLRE